jgi:CheY-like chemotaxis protein
MKKKLELVLLVDDFDGANYLHQKVINELGCAKTVHVEKTGDIALDFLQKESNGKFPQPEIIFLDLNMPGMSGWEFMEEYKKLTREQRWGTLIVILTTSHNPDDVAKARKKHPNTLFVNKPLLRSSIEAILKEYFSDNF